MLKKLTMRSVIALAALMLGACHSGAQNFGDLTWGRAELVKLGSIELKGLTESSGLVASTVRPGVYWTFEDSGNEAELYAIDSAGRDLGRMVLSNARNEDWEAISSGPCGDERCLYIGDVGDNLELRPSRVIYRVREPASGGDRRVSVTAEWLQFRYEDGPHDVESMVVTNDGAIHLFTKGRSGGLLVFRLAPDAWSGGNAVAVRTDSLHLTVPTGDDLITDAALAPDGALAIRSGRTLYLFRMDVETGELLSPRPEKACDLSPADEPQGEGIAWMKSGAWLLTSEKKGAPITRVRCR